MVTDDLNLPEDLALDPTTAPLAGKSAPLPPGTYEIVIKKFQQEKTTRDGAPALKMVKGKSYKQAQIDSFQVISPFPFDKKMVYAFQPVTTVPKQRNGKFTTELYDFLLAYDQTTGVANSDEGLQLASSYVASEKPIRVHTTLAALDMAYIEQRKATEMTKEENNEMWTKARLTVKDFTSPTGQILHSVTGPSGNPVEPRVVINVFYPSNFQPRLGPDSEKGK